MYSSGTRKRFEFEERLSQGTAGLMAAGAAAGMNAAAIQLTHET